MAQLQKKRLCLTRASSRQRFQSACGKFLFPHHTLQPLCQGFPWSGNRQLSQAGSLSREKIIQRKQLLQSLLFLR